MSKLFPIALTTLCVLVFSQLHSQNTLKETSKDLLVIGEIVTLPSKILLENRILNIYLPEGYKAQDTFK